MKNVFSKWLALGIMVCAFGLNSFAASTSKTSADDIVQVLINGKTYSCSAGGEIATSCQNSVDYAQANFDQCRKTYSADYCFSKAYSKTSKPSNCVAWSKGCAQACGISYSADYCWTQCYE